MRLFYVMRSLSLNTVATSAHGWNRAAGFILVALLWLLAVSVAQANAVDEGKRLATDRSKGNCLACHAMGDGPLAGNVGPPLIVMQARYPEREALFNQIWDATSRNPDSRMPPFGSHGVLSKEEIELIIDYLYTL